MSIFSLSEFSSVGIKIGFWINSAGLNNNKSALFELGLAYEKFGVWARLSRKRFFIKLYFFHGLLARRQNVQPLVVAYITLGEQIQIQ